MALDFSQYTGARRQARASYRNDAAINEYSRFLSQIRGRRNISDYKRDFRRSVPKVTSSYGQQGLAGPGVSSGVYQRAMSDYLGDYTRGLGRMQTDFRNTMNQFNLNADQLLERRNATLADINRRKADDIAQAALYLSKLKPLYS